MRHVLFAMRQFWCFRISSQKVPIAYVEKTGNTARAVKLR